MAEIVLRVHLIGGDRIDVTYGEPRTPEPAQVIEQAISTLAEDSGALRTRHGDRIVVLYGRGVAALEVAPRGAVL
jgi:hypothetical protein